MPRQYFSCFSENKNNLLSSNNTSNFFYLSFFFCSVPRAAILSMSPALSKTRINLQSLWASSRIIFKSRVHCLIVSLALGAKIMRIPQRCKHWHRIAGGWPDLSFRHCPRRALLAAFLPFLCLQMSQEEKKDYRINRKKNSTLCL